MAHKVLDLVNGYGITDPRIDPATLVERTPAVDADQFALHVEERPAAIAGIDRCIDLDAIGVFQKRPFRVLVTMHAADQTERDGGSEVGRQHERIAHGQGPIALLDPVAVAQRREGEFLPLPCAAAA